MVHTPGNTVLASESAENHAVIHRKSWSWVGVQRAGICWWHCPAQPRTGTPGQRNTLPMGEEDTEPHSHGERKWAVFFGLAPRAWGERREGIIYKMVDPWHTQTLGGYFLDGDKVWLPMGKWKASQRSFHGRVYCLKKFFWSIFKETRFSPGCC